MAQSTSLPKVALITGVTGQDGSYLAELLLEKGYVVHGIKRRASSFNTERVDHIYQDPHIDNARFKLHYGDLSDSSNLVRIIQETQPDEIYNLGAQSHVAVSFESPEYTADVDGMGTLRILEAIRILGLEKRTRFYQASTSELYGLVQETPQKETTPFYPRSPYAVAKLYAYWITVNYREAYGIYACNGILFNHESPRRGETFVTRKITRAARALTAYLDPPTPRRPRAAKSSLNPPARNFGIDRSPARLGMTEPLEHEHRRRPWRRKRLVLDLQSRRDVGDLHSPDLERGVWLGVHDFALPTSQLSRALTFASGARM